MVVIQTWSDNGLMRSQDEKCSHRHLKQSQGDADFLFNDIHLSIVLPRRRRTLSSASYPLGKWFGSQQKSHLLLFIVPVTEFGRATSGVFCSRRWRNATHLSRCTPSIIFIKFLYLDQSWVADEFYTQGLLLLLYLSDRLSSINWLLGWLIIN